MNIERTILDFSTLPQEEQEWLLNETWCSTCNKADLGITEPVYYSEEGKKYIEGKCPICKTETRTQIVNTEVNENNYPQ